MQETDDRRIPHEALQANVAVHQVLRDSVAGIYLFGSAVSGGLRVNSDVDVLVAVNQYLSYPQRLDLLARLMAVSGKIGNSHSVRPLELTIVHLSEVVPWRYPPRAEFVYGEWLRDEFENGKVPQPVYDPDLAIVLKNVIDGSVPICGPDASQLFEPIPMTDIRRAMADSLPALLEGLRGDERNVILTLARMWLTAALGEIAPKDVAAQWAIGQLPPEQALLLDEARLAYRGEMNDSWDHHQRELSALVDHMRKAIERCLGV